MKDYFFTFGTGQPHFPGYVRVSAEDGFVAREMMFEVYGRRWSMQYDDIEKICTLDRIEVDHLKKGDARLNQEDKDE